jgi:hypothetical protein
VQPPRAEWQDPVDLVSAPHGALLVRSAAYSPGWSVTIVPTAGASRASAEEAGVSLPVRGVGGLQGVDLPPGRWTVTWRYRSVRAEVGLLAGVLGLIILALLFATGARRGRRARGITEASQASDLEEAGNQLT